MHTNASFVINKGSAPFPMIAHVASPFSGFIFKSGRMALLPTCRHTVGDHAPTSGARLSRRVRTGCASQLTPGQRLLPVLKPPFVFGGAVVGRVGSATDELVAEADASGFGLLSSCCAAEAASDAASLIDDDVAASGRLVKKFVML